MDFDLIAIGIIFGLGSFAFIVALSSELREAPVSSEAQRGPRR